ncbi:hypothetical protein AtubIFM55763_007913 [Aspergillus tubingensis]|nr:hypothetical protein AtubIFM55763_007913 [Aspergillus tubingensis]GLA96442.1 hypothetical protein AtubIFM57143_003908 [Aspergillus tubingensis]GLB23695.1 hypothetical protein AtubIFM61612_004294 [Aspergillus tubingensis]
MANSTNLSHGDRVGCTPGLPEVRSAEEDWTGLTDPALRRKLQNRLNQRIYRMPIVISWCGGQRRRAKPAANTSELDINPATTERAGNSLASEDQCERIEQERTNAVASREESEDALASPKSSIQPPTSIHQMSRAEILQIMAQYEAKARKDYALGSPRVDQLLTLIQFNVFRALVDNTSALGFTMDWLDEEAMSPWCASRYGNFDEAALCNDLVDFYDVTNDETCLIVWTTPWHPTGWEVSETFLRKWNWVLRGCDDLAKSTNYWRRLRGEEPLNFDYGLQ